MPVGINSPARNLFLLGSSGAQIVTNFFRTIDQTGSTDGVFIPDEIRYNESDEKYLLAGTANDTNSKRFGWFEKRNEGGTADWNVRVESPENTTLRAMELDVNGNLTVVGKTNNIPWIAKYSNSGVIDWQSTTNSADVEYTGITSDSNGQYYACGTTSGLDTKVFVEKFDTDGTPDWGKSAFMLGRDIVLNKIDCNSRGEVVAVGYLDDDLSTKGYVVKIDTNTGEVLWDRTIRIVEDYTYLECTNVFIDEDDQIYIVGLHDTGSFLIKYTPEGNMIWQRDIDNVPDYFSIYDVRSNGSDINVFGEWYDDDGITGLGIAKYTKDGSLTWFRQIGSSYNDFSFIPRYPSLDASLSYYYVLFTDENTSVGGGIPDRYTYGKLSVSGNGLGSFEYNEGTGEVINYDIININSKIGRFSDGSVRNDSSDFITYPFNANNLLFDDLATQITNKKRQMDGPDSFEYSGSPAIRPADFQELNLLGDAGVTSNDKPLVLNLDGTNYINSGDWKDISGFTNHGTIENATFNSVSKYFDFDDANIALIRCNNPIPADPTSPFTMEAWAWRDDTSRWQTVMSMTGSYTQIAFASDNTIRCGRNGGGGGINANSNFTTSTSTWYHIVLTYDGNNDGTGAYASIYVNGELKANQTNIGVNGFNNGSEVRIGSYGISSDGELLDGRVGEARIYNRALTATEVLQNYNATKGRYLNVSNFGSIIKNETDTWLDQSRRKSRVQILGVPSNVNSNWNFNNNGDRIEVLDYTPTGKNISVDTWVKFNSFPTQPTSKGYVWDQSPGATGASLRVATNNLFAAFAYPSSGGGVSLVNSTTTAQTNTWYHITTTFAQNQVKIYINGSLEGTSTTSFNTINNPGSIPFTIGASADNSGEIGQIEYTSPGQYIFEVPANVTSVSMVLVGGGGGGSNTDNSSNGVSGGGGGGGALMWRNGYSVSPGDFLYVTVGSGGIGGSTDGVNDATDGGDSFVRIGSHSGTIIARAGGGGKGSYSQSAVIVNNGGIEYSSTYGGGGSISGGGNGGRGGYGITNNAGGGGGGAGGYTGDGGKGNDTNLTSAGFIRTAGSGGGGGGGGGSNTTGSSIITTAGGGGVQIYGQGTSGNGSPSNNISTQGSLQGYTGSVNAIPGQSANIVQSKLYGGGGCGAEDDAINLPAADGGSGAVRLLWGSGREFPSTNVADLAGTDSREYFDGEIGEIRIYDRVLNATEVLQNYNATREKYTGVPASTDPGLTSTRTPA